VVVRGALVGREDLVGGASRGELQSVIKLIASSLDVSLARVL
jgi:hypothetical protein